MAEMELYLGIDGGGTRTRAIICNRTGEVIGRGDAGPSNFQEAGSETAIENLKRAIHDALCGYGTGEIVAAFFGMAGVVSREDHAEVHRMAGLLGFATHCEIGVDHDIRIALTGGLAGAPGIALIAGTGSSCYGRTRDGQSVQCGGWGSLADDVGSGGWMGRLALEKTVRQADGRDPETALKNRVFAFLGIPHIENFMYRVHHVGLPRDQLATLARDVLDLEQQGDPAASAIVRQGIAGLTELAAVAKRRLQLQEARVVLAGGLIKHLPFADQLKAHIQTEVEGTMVVPAQFPPVIGACLEALRLHNIDINETVVENLKNAPFQS